MIPIAAGTVLVERGTPLPELLKLEVDSAAAGWAPAAGNLKSQQLEKELTAAGWTFFYMAAAIKVTAFGSAMEKPLDRLIRAVKLQRCNCLEIDGVEACSFWGFPYVKMSAHPRHIQKGMVFPA
jgi:hypothetical protein